MSIILPLPEHILASIIFFNRSSIEEADTGRILLISINYHSYVDCQSSINTLTVNLFIDSIKLKYNYGLIFLKQLSMI